MRKTRVLLADDHPFLRGGLRLVLDRQSDLIVVAEAADGRQAVDEAARVRPDIAVLDIAMPNLNGVEAAFQIHANLLQHLLHEIFCLDRAATFLLLYINITRQPLRARAAFTTRSDISSIISGGNVKASCRIFSTKAIRAILLRRWHTRA